MPLNTDPSNAFMQRMNANPGSMNRPRMGGQAPPMGGRMRPGIMPRAPGIGGPPPMGNPSPMSPPMGMSGGPTMPIVQGPSQMPPFMSGNSGINGGNLPMTGGMPMGGFSQPQVETGNMINGSPMGNGLWNKYQNMQRPQMSPMFR